MSVKIKLSKSARRHIREEKARIRKEFPSSEEREEKINELYGKFLPKEKEEKKEAKPASKKTSPKTKAKKKNTAKSK
ncbi:MAG: hypothetical protein WDZ39_00070 [Candidatus Spechtbacterales bacterium]